MSNVVDFGVNGSFGSKVGGLGTTVKYFPRPLGPSIGVAPSTPSSTSAVGAMFLPAQNVFNGQLFNVIASGNFGSDSGDPSGTVTIAIYAVTGSLAAPTYTSVATTPAIVPFFAVEPWSLSLEMVGSSTSGANGLLIGSYTSQTRIGLNSTPAASTVVSGLDFNAGNPALAQGAVLGFVVGATFGTSDATNKASLLEFTIES